MSVKQMNFGNLQRFSSKAVQKNSSFLCSGFLKMSKLKTTNGWVFEQEKDPVVQ